MSKSDIPKGPQASKGLTELIGHALIDEQYRNLLFDNRAEAIKQYNLSDIDLNALDHLSRQDLEQNAEVFGSETALLIKIVIKGTF